LKIIADPFPQGQSMDDQRPQKRILCIEDEPEMIDLIRLILGRRGFEVMGATGGQAGL
jgi:CheY-like chemotaxis protein